MPFVAPIVEGHGEVTAVPVLLRRLYQALEPSQWLTVNEPARVKAQAFFQMGKEFHRHVFLAAGKAAQEQGGVLILMDCEDDCPATLGPKLLAAAKGVRGDVPYLVVLARREFETWFIAAAPSLQGVCGLPVDLTAPEYFEEIRDAKGWLGRRMPNGYKETEHQQRLAARFDLRQARSARSFDRLIQRLPGFLASLPG
ncbi:MAG TPA: DUF4276 family protein [Azospirillaceae bacterium]|nr:DUF4276 family protein [Azospirillaceae bacterium]HRQ80318.1 DUF4276 family protein [Azospirillaceae bacterium]